MMGDDCFCLVVDAGVDGLSKNMPSHIVSLSNKWSLLFHGLGSVFLQSK